MSCLDLKCWMIFASLTNKVSAIIGVHRTRRLSGHVRPSLASAERLRIILMVSNLWVPAASFVGVSVLLRLLTMPSDWAQHKKYKYNGYFILLLRSCSPLYRRRSLQVNSHFASFVEIYKIVTPLHHSKQRLLFNPRLVKKEKEGS